MCKGEALAQAGASADNMGGGSVGRPLQGCAAQPPVLAWRVHDHHFAPGVERLVARYESRNLANDELTVTVTDQAGMLVYRQRGTGNADGNHSFGDALGWDGKGNIGSWSTLLITPLESPYRVRVEATHAGTLDEFELHVLYHSIRIDIGTWTEDGNPPSRLAAPAAWVQYKLNELGYYAGPVDGVVGDQTKRAMRRYLRMTPTMGPNSATSPNFHTNAQLQNALHANNYSRTILAPGLPLEGATARLYVDQNLFYEHFADFSSASGVTQMEAANLDRPELPLEVTVLLVGRGDADGTGVGVSSPDAVGAVRVKWWVHDAPEDTSTLLASSPACPTRMRAYVNAALANTRAGSGEDNCPDTHGGARNTGGHVNPSYFRIGTQLPPYTSTAVGNVVRTSVHTGIVAGKRGKTGILFRASHIGGDDFRVEARLSFSGLPNKWSLISGHEELHGTWEDRRRVSTGKMVVWRRMPVAGVVDWPASGRAAIDWNRVSTELQHAYIELVHPPAAMTGAQFLANIVPAAQLNTFQADLGLRVNGAGPMVLAGNAMFQIPIPPQGADEHAREYKARVDALLRSSLDLDAGYAALQNYTSYMQDYFKQAGHVGAVIIHGKWVPTINLVHHPLRGLGNPVPDTYDPKLSCIGLPYGVTILNQGMFVDFSDQFAVCHEMAHTRFLRHHEKGDAENNPHFHAQNNPSANPDDHDTADHNCTMCYPWLIPSRNRRPLIGQAVTLEWSPTSVEESAFCGKCLLKLRGWDITRTLPAHS
jgi:peptidoglycan hydrolase-like protein with peptidoglycan-binding domain